MAKRRWQPPSRKALEKHIGFDGFLNVNSASRGLGMSKKTIIKYADKMGGFKRRVRDPQVVAKIRKSRNYAGLNEATKNKIAQTLKERYINQDHALKGRPLPEERIKKMSQAFTGERNPMYGRTHTKKARQSMSKKRRGRKDTPKTRAKKSDARMGDKNPMWGLVGKNHPKYGISPSEETRAKMSFAHKERWAKIHFAIGQTILSDKKKVYHEFERIGRKTASSEQRRVPVLSTAPENLGEGITAEQKSESPELSEETLQTLYTALSQLSPLRRGIINSAFGLSNGIPMSHEQIANKLEISPIKVKREYERALSFLNKNKKLRYLYGE